MRYLYIFPIRIPRTSHLSALLSSLTLKMRLSSVILELFLIFHVAGHPITGESSASVQDEGLYERTSAEIFQMRDSKRHPTAPEARSITSRATQSCHAYDHGIFISFDILIRVPYGGKDDCDATYHSLEDWTHSVTSWKCLNNNGYVQLYFNAANWNIGDNVNAALSSRYPSVDSFNCPDD